MPIDTTKAILIGTSGIYAYDEGIEEKPYSVGGVYAKWNLCCNWNERQQLSNYLAGIPPFVGATPPPIFHYPNLPSLITSDILIKGDDSPLGIDPNTGITKYDKAKMTVTFAPPQVGGAFNNDATIDVIDLDFTADAIRLPGESFTFADGSKVDSEAAPVMVIPTADVIIPRSGRTALNAPLIMSLEGQVNSAIFLGAAAETVLFLGAKTRQRFVQTVTSVWDKVFHFKVRPPGITWNFAWNKANKVFEVVTPKPYTLANLSVLLTS
jgi:hypothetical protein